MKHKHIYILSSFIVVLQLIGVFVVCYKNPVIKGTSQSFFIPIISAFMFSSVPLFAVKSLKSNISGSNFPKAKSAIILTTSVVLAVIDSLVWINFVLTTLRLYGSDAYISKIKYIDELIVFFPVVSMMIQFVLFLFAFTDIKTQIRKKWKKIRAKKSRSKKGKTERKKK